MKKIRAQAKNIITALFGLVLALCASVFAVYAWFAYTYTAESGISASVDEAYITDFSYTAYALSGKSEADGVTKYTVGDEYTKDSNGGLPIGTYGSSSVAALLVVTYKVKDGENTKITFNGTDSVTEDDVIIKDDGYDSSLNEYYDYVQTDLSNAISMRLAEYDEATSSISSGNTERCFFDTTAGNIKQEVIFNDIETQSDYSVTLYILMEYDDDNVSALYDMNDDAYLSMPISFTNDLSLEIIPAEDHVHTYGKWTVTKYSNTSGIALAAEEEDYAYTATRTCTGCATGTDGHTQTVNIKASEVTTSGNTATATVTVEGVECIITFSAVAMGDTSHTHTYTAEWSWSTDYSTATVTLTCSGCTADVDGHTVTQTATVDSSTSGCVTTYTAAVTYNGTEYTDAQTVTKHNIVDGTCTDCGASIASITIYGDTEMEEGTTITLTATVLMTDETEYTGDITWSYESENNCWVSLYNGSLTAYYSDTITVTAAVGNVSATHVITVTHTHSYGSPSWEWSYDYSTATASFTCTSSYDDTQEVEATVTSVTTSATCTENGTTVYTATVTFNGTTYTDTQTVVNEYTSGHSYSSEWSYDQSSHWHECTVCGEKTDVASHTYGSDGYCTVCGASSTVEYTATYTIDSKASGTTGTDAFDVTYNGTTDSGGSVTVSGAGGNGITYKEDSSTYTGYSGYSEFKTSRYAVITSEENVTITSIKVYASTGNTSRVLYISTTAPSDTSGAVATSGSDTTYILAASGLTTAGQTYYVWATDTIKVYAIEVTYTVTNTTTATVSGVTISGDTSVDEGETLTLTADVAMSDGSAYDGTVSWSSSDTSVATVSDSGVVTAVSAGTATITATADGVSGTYEITVNSVTTHTHTYVVTTWYWFADDYAGASFSCSCGSNVQWVEATVTSETTEATCITDGSIVYTATIIYNDTTYTDTNIVTISATGEHTYTWYYDSDSHWQVCSVCGNTTESEAHTYDSDGKCTVCGATVTAHTNTFNVSELVTAIEARTGETISDKTQLETTDFTGSNAFLTLLEEQTANQYRTNNDGVIEIKGEGLAVTFTGAGTITISFASTGTTNVSSLALIDENGKYITGVLSETTATTETVTTENGYYYNVTGSSTYVTITFTVSTAGTYIIATNLDSEQNRGARISSIVMVDNYVDTNVDTDND